MVRISAIFARSFSSSKNSTVVASQAALVFMNEYFSSSRGIWTSTVGSGIPISLPGFSRVEKSNVIPALTSCAVSRPTVMSIRFSAPYAVPTRRSRSLSTSFTSSTSLISSMMRISRFCSSSSNPSRAMASCSRTPKRFDFVGGTS